VTDGDVVTNLTPRPSFCLRRPIDCRPRRQSGVPHYLGSPDDLKLLLMKAVNRKTSSHGYRVQNGSRLSFQGRWYVYPGLLSRLAGREFEVFYRPLNYQIPAHAKALPLTQSAGEPLNSKIYALVLSKPYVPLQESRFQPNFEKCGRILTAFSVILRANERIIEMRKGA